MTATERLRELLDERGVEWKAPASYDGSTKYDTIVDDYWFHEYDGGITVHGLTPEQAIAATLKVGTCHNTQEGRGDAMSEYKPITCKIRERMEQAERIFPIVDAAQYTQVRINLAWLTERLDEIDSIHAALEAENERLREQEAQAVRNIGGDAE